MSNELVIIGDCSSENRAWAGSKEFDRGFTKVGIRPEGAEPLMDTELLDVLLNYSQNTKD